MKKIALLFFLLSVFYVKGQVRTLTGQVTDKKTGEPVVGAHIMTYPSQRIAVSNFDGSYILEGVAAGDTVLKVTMVGYIGAEQNIKSSKQTIDFELEESLCEFSEVVVTGTRTLKTLNDTPILTKLISKQQIQASGASSALDILEFSLPGVSFSRNPHNTSMEIQGLGNRYILVLLDGQRMTGETLDQVNMSRINSDDIEKIEVLGGAASALYGSNAIGSVVNIITKKNREKWQGDVGVKYGYENKDLINDLTFGYKNENFDVRFSGFRRSSDGYDLTPDDNKATQPAYIDYSGKITAKYDVSKKARLNVLGSYFRNDNESGETFVSGHKLRENYTYGIGAEVKFSDKNFLVLKASADDSKQSDTNLGDKPDEVFGKNSFKTISLLNTYTHSDDLQIVFGTDYNYESVYSLTTFGPEPASKSIKDFNTYIQADYKILPELDFITGLRYTHHPSFGSHYTPKFSLMYKLNYFKFRGNLSWGYKTPSLKHLYYNFFMGGQFWIYGNPKLDAEKSFYNSFSIEYGRKDFNFSVNLFKNTLDDKIDGYFKINTETGQRAMYYKNYSSVTIRGLETFVNLRLWNDFTSQLGYNFLETKDLETNRELPGVSKHSGTWGLTWSNTRMKYPISLNISGRVHSPRQYFEEKAKKDGTGATTGNVITSANEAGFALWRATYSQDFKLYEKYKLKVQLGVDNILDYKKNETVINPGRTFWGALRIYL